MKKIASTALDVRPQHDQLEIGLFEGSKGVGRSGASRQEFQIYCDFEGNEIGSMLFYIYNGWPLNKIDPSAYKSSQVVQDFIYIKEVRVHDRYQGLGIGQLIYKKFGEVYNDQFNGFVVGKNYANPVAEYAYRKAVGLGYIPELALNEEYTSREYDTTEQKNKAKDLREKLPENVRGPEVWSSIDRKAEATMIDARNLTCDIQEQDIVENGAERTTTNNIILNLQSGERVGNISFTAYVNVSARKLGYSKNWEDFIEKIVYIDRISVRPEFRNNGIALELYKKFGEIYSSKYQNWPIAREFLNPIAEYTYRKAISIGLVPEDTMNEEYITRAYSDEQKELAKDLRNKLPENVKGPEVWSKRF